jgi:hypothetical protein
VRRTLSFTAVRLCPGCSGVVGVSSVVSDNLAGVSVADERICTAIPVLGKSIVTPLSAVGSDRCSNRPWPGTLIKIAGEPMPSCRSPTPESEWYEVSALTGANHVCGADETGVMGTNDVAELKWIFRIGYSQPHEAFLPVSALAVGVAR